MLKDARKKEQGEPDANIPPTWKKRRGDAVKVNRPRPAAFLVLLLGLFLREKVAGCM
jgi:hypothetical protein